jgi:hypothetical protein
MVQLRGKELEQRGELRREDGVPAVEPRRSVGHHCGELPDQRLRGEPGERDLRRGFRAQAKLAGKS